MADDFNWEREVRPGGTPPQAPNQAPNQQVQNLTNWLDDFEQQDVEYPSQPTSIADQISAMPNSEKISPVERWLYGKLPGFSQSSVGKALETFSLSPAGKALAFLDVAAEGLERTLGVLEQYRAGSIDEDTKLKDAWFAGSLFWDTAQLPRIQYDENGKPTGISLDTTMPGTYALIEARKLLAEGKTLEEVRETMYNNMGALALRSQLQDTLGHVVGDPLNFALGILKPVERLHAIRHLALAGKLSPEVAQDAIKVAQAAGKLDDVKRITEALETAQQQGKAMTRFDKFVVNLTGGTPYLQSVGDEFKGVQTMTKGQKLANKLNPFALTPQAQASELVDMVAANVGEHLIRPNWNADPEVFLKQLAGAARGSIGGEWGHLASTVQGRAVQGVLSNSDGVATALGKEWATYRGERNLLQAMASIMPGTDERKLWLLAKENPALLFKKLVSASQQPGGELLAAEIQSGKLSEKMMEAIGKIEGSVPLTKEMFYTKARAMVEDVAMQQSILQFGVKEKGLITKWTDMLKAWESIPFIKANPANAFRNVVNNEVTLIGRGLHGVMGDGAIREFWQGKYIPPQFTRSFGLSGADEAVFDSAYAAKTLTDALEGSNKSLPQKMKMAAGKVKLGFMDFSVASANAEQAASRRASTMGWMEFHNKYWNPRTGFTSIKKSLDPATLEAMEQAVPGITDVLDDVARASKADSAKFSELMQDSLEHNVGSIVKNTEDALGYKLDDVLGADVMHRIESGLPDAIKKGNVREFVDSVRMEMEKHVDDMFNQHVENLPGIIAAQVQAGGPLQYHRVFGKAMDEMWGGNIEHAIRMSTVNDAIDYAKASGDWSKVDSLWGKIFQDGENHFGRVWKKFDAYQEGLKQGAINAKMKYPKEVANSFGNMKKGWQDFFDFRNSEYKNFFDAKLKGSAYKKELDAIQNEIQAKFKKMVGEEDRLFQQIDDLMAGSLPDPNMSQVYKNYRDQAAQLRELDRTKTADFFEKVRKVPSSEAPNMWQKFWQERGTRLEQMRQMDMYGSAATQGDPEQVARFASQMVDDGAEPTDLFGLASKYGIPSATKTGARNNRRILNTVNKYLPEGSTKFKNVEDIPMDVAKQAFDARAATQAEGAVNAAERAFIPDAEKMFPDPMPIETGLSELNYGRSYAAVDQLTEQAISQSTKKSSLLKDLPEGLQKKVQQWQQGVDGEMSSFRSAGVQYAAFRRDSALLNYNRRTNFDNLVGHAAPFAFWTTHSVFNWAVHSLDRPAMLTSYFRARKFFETAGLADQNVPTRLKGNIRVELPFTPEWMGDTFVNPMRFLLPFDGFMMPWESAHNSKFTMEKKISTTLDQMLEEGVINEEDYQEAVTNQSGDAWDRAKEHAEEGGENYDAMDFVSMTMTPHAPLMWAYNAMNGNKQDIGPFTPMSRTARNVATMMGVDDWSNSPYNVEGRIRKAMGLPAFDKWDDYRVGREISNMAADQTYDMVKIQEAMEIAALVESGKMTSADAVKGSEVYGEATKRANQEYAGGVVGTLTAILGVPVRAFPTGEQRQRELAEQFSDAYQQYDAGNPEALSKFFDDNPEYESRLALFKTPDERLKTFMVDHVWSKWNDMPKVNQDELKEQLGSEFADKFVNKETRSYDTITPMQLSIWLKLMKGKPVGTLSAETEAMLELNQIKLTDPETAWRVQSFYDMRGETPDWYKLQSKYYSLPEGKRSDFIQENPQLKMYWDNRRNWMNQNPDLVRYLTDDEKQLKKFESMRRDPEIAVPTAQELSQNMSPSMQELVQDWTQGQTLPTSLRTYIQQIAQQQGLTERQVLGILTGQ